MCDEEICSSTPGPGVSRTADELLNMSAALERGSTATAGGAQPLTAKLTKNSSSFIIFLHSHLVFFFPPYVHDVES